MPYWTQGVVTLHAVSKKISITPTADYEINHDKLKYIIFMETPTRNKIKFFLNGHLFAFKTSSLKKLRSGSGRADCGNLMHR
jgi:hypothetical protein